jgi:hypothetical protein
MDFYRLKKPGSEWFARQGDAIKASRAEKVEWEKVEVPDSKPERLAWLNAHARGGAVDDGRSRSIRAGTRSASGRWSRRPRTHPGFVRRSSETSEQEWSSCRSVTPPRSPPHTTAARSASGRSRLRSSWGSATSSSTIWRASSGWSIFAGSSFKAMTARVDIAERFS